MAYSLNCRLVAVCVWLTAIILLQTVKQSDATCCTRHVESYTYQVTVSHYYCYPYSYTYCNNWWYYNYWWWGWGWYYPYYWGYYWNPWYYRWGWWNWCYTQTYYNCYYTYTLEARTGQRCVSGWVGSNCDIPTCTPACLQGMTCSDLNVCTCAATAAGSANCQIVPCSPTNNCYPGTCESNVCKCPPGFNGTNCEQILHQPTIKTCGASLTAKASPGAASTQVAHASCAAPGESPIIVWVNSPGLNIGTDLAASQNNGFGLDSLTVSWTPSYVFPLSMPEKPPLATQFFVSNVPVAIYLTEATYTLTFPNSNNYTTTKTQCNMGAGNPTQYDCVVTSPWNILNINSQIGHNKTMIVNMAAKLGGAKTGNAAYTLNNVAYGFPAQQFQGTLITYSAAFRFDLVRPTHCLLVNSSHPEYCTGYPIQLGQDIRSDPAISPKVTDWLDDGSGISRFSFQVFFMQPDTYGVLALNGNPFPDSVATLAAADVGNYHFTVPTPGVYSILVTVYDHANNSAVARKVFNYINSPSYTIDSTKPVYLQEANPNVNYTFISQLITPRQVNLVWTGRFIPTDQWQSVFAARVNPLAASNGYTIDDVYGTQFGQRSLAAHDNQTGISTYVVRWYVDNDHGGIYALPEMADNTSTKTVTTESTTIYLSQPLTSGSTIVVWLTATGVTSDNTTYKIVTHVDTSPPNVTAYSFVKNGAVDGYSSRLTLTMFDQYGGINSTNYTVVDMSNHENVVVPPTWQTLTQRLFPSTKKKRSADLLDKPCSPSDTSCYCTPFQKCYNYIQTIDIDNCLLDRYSNRDNFHLQLRYWVTNLAGLSTGTNYVDLGDLTGVQCRPSGLPPGAIAGIVIACIIGFLILLCLIILIIVIVIRIRDNKHPIPSRAEMRTYAGNVRNRFTMRHADRSANNDLYAANVNVGAKSGQVKNNAAYKADPDDDMYVDKSDFDKSKIPKKQVQVGDVLVEGRFAVVRRGYYMKANDKQPVAVKALKNGFSQQDEQLMTKKVAFMKNVLQHGNLVAFYGFIDENDGQGPIMVLELCDYPLTNWLERLSRTTPDDLEQMLIFSLNIAQGVQHLHSNKIIHRRLAARNVLIKQQVNGLVAKLIGFGPTAEDIVDDNTGSGSAVAVPKKWLAPETLDTCNSRNPTYNEKTDAWSYGVTIWEIYSKGAVPYGDVRSNDIQSLVKRGERLKRPSDCPDELYNEVMKRCWEDKASKRPTFKTIQEWIQRFRTGNADQGGYYAANDNNGELYSDGR